MLEASELPKLLAGTTEPSGPVRLQLKLELELTDKLRYEEKNLPLKFFMTIHIHWIN